ncbi:MAG: cell division protein FtsQ/DivIB [Alphaproteobacteria bacterium]|jgi:cell division protein FtsQ
MKNKFLFWLMFCIAILLAIYIAVRISMVSMGIGGILSDVKKVSVYSDNGKASDLITRLGIDHTDKHIDLNDVLARVASDPDIANVAVRRLPNGEIKIRADMRVIVASWTDGENYYPLDDTGAPINKPSSTRPENTLVFSGQVPQDLSKTIKIVKHTPNLFYSIDRMEFIEDRRWDIFLLNGMKIMLPEENFEQAITKIDNMNKQNMILDRQIKLLDMRDLSRPLVKL